LTSLLLPCYSVFDLLAGPGADDMSVSCRLCNGHCSLISTTAADNAQRSSAYRLFDGRA